MPYKSCPSRDELSGYVRGTLPPSQSDSVTVHLAYCTDCEDTIHRLESLPDPLVDQIRGAPAAEPYVDEAACRKVVESVERLGPGAGGPAPLAERSIVRPVSEQIRPMNHTEFVEFLTTTGFVAANELTAVEKQLPPAEATDVQALARSLVAHGKLTKYQAAAVYQGKGKSLVYGDYLVLDRIGAGGMGQVFKARHKRMDRIVALKVLPTASMKNADAVKRFEREVRAAAKLTHPNIVHAYDAGLQDGAPYLVMEFVDGPDLSSIVKKQGKLAVIQACDFLAQAARGFAFAHAKGIVHRDIKPGNLLVDHDGTVKVLDMGLARFDDLGGGLMSEGELTQSGAVMGTVDYMAPEQALNTSLADAKSDVYGLGCTLYRLLTGEAVYAGKTMVEKILAHREQPVPSLRRVRPDAPPALEALAARMLAKSPADRPSMQEIADALAAIGAGGPVPASLVPAGMPTAAPFIPQAVSVAPSAAPGFAPDIGPPTVPGLAPSRTKAALPPRRRSNTGLVAAAAAGAVFIAFGIWIYINNKDGKPIAVVQAPEGSTVTIVPDATSSATATPPAPPSNAIPVGTDPINMFLPPGATPTSTSTAGSNSPAGMAPGVPPVPAASAANLYLRPAVFARGQVVARVDSLHYDGSTPLTVEAWYMPMPTPEMPAIFATPNNNNVKRSDIPAFGFADGFGAPAHLSISWMAVGDDPAGDRWVASWLSLINGQPKRMSEQVAPARRGVATHVAIVLGAKVDGRQKVDVYFDGKLAKSETTTLVHDGLLPFLSQGFVDEIRVSKVVRYAGDFSPRLRFEPDADTIALYHCDEGSGDILVDSSGYDNHGKLTGAVWAPVTSPAGPPIATALPPATPPASGVADGDLYVYPASFDEKTPCITVPSITYDGKTNLTIEAWFVVPQPESLGAPFTTAASQSPAVGVFGFNLANEPNLRGAWTYTPGTASPFRTSQFFQLGQDLQGTTRTIGLPSMPPGLHHMVLVLGSFSGGTPTLTASADGKRIVQQRIPLRVALNSQFASHGYLSELHIRKSGGYPSTYAPPLRFEPDADTIALYHCDEGSGDILIDSSGNNNHGKLTGAKWAKVNSLPGPTFATAPAAVTSPAVAGAPSTIPAGPIDLLAQVQLPRDVLTGNWTRNGGSLVGQADPARGCRLTIPFTPLDEQYDLVLTGKLVQSVPGQDSIFIGMVAQGKQFFLRYGAKGCGISDGDATRLPDFTQRNLDLTQPFTIVCAVRKDSVRTDFNGQMLLDYRGDYNTLRMTKPLSAEHIRKVFLDFEGSAKFEITSFRYVPGGGPTSPAIATSSPAVATPAVVQPIAGPSIDLLALVQLPRDKVQGNWSRSGSTLALRIGGGPGGRVQIPYTPTGDEYDLALTGRHAWEPRPVAVVLGMVVGGKQIYCRIGRKSAGISDGDTNRAPNIAEYPELPLEQRFTILCSVRKNAIRVLFNDQPLYEFQGDLRQLAGPEMTVPRLDQLFLSVDIDTAFDFDSLKLTPLGWTALPQTATTILPTTGSTAGAASRQPVPEPTALQAALSAVKEVFKDDYAAAKTPAKKSELAAKLYEQSRQAVDATERYVLLDEALSLGAEGDEVDNARRALKSLVEEFDVGVGATYVAGWKALLAKARPPEVVRALLLDANQVFDSTVKTAQFDDAKAIGDFATTTAARLRDVVEIKLVRDRNAELVVRQKEHAAARTALEKLATTPDDPEANHTVGRYRALVEKDWVNALPLLSKGSDAVWKELAAKTIAAGNQPAAVSAVADAWWDAAQTKPAQKAELSAGARFWYQVAIGSLAGLQKTRVENRITEAGLLAAESKIPITLLPLPASAAAQPATVGDDRPVMPVRTFGDPSPTTRSGPTPVAPANALLTDPAFQQWMRTVAAMPADQQAAAVSRKLVELNPGFEEKNFIPTIEAGVVTRLRVISDKVRNIAPVRALVGLQELDVPALSTGAGNQSGFSDLSPLAGMNLTSFNCVHTSVSDLTPLRGMPLTTLTLRQANVMNLSPLAGMRLTNLSASRTKVTDLSPLAGMPLTQLDLNLTPVSDPSPLFGCKDLKTLAIQETQIPPAGVDALKRALPQCSVVGVPNPSAPAGAAAGVAPNARLPDPAFQQWINQVAALPAQQQVDAVSKKMMELNPGFDGVLMPVIGNGVVTELRFNSNTVTNIAPVRALASLKFLSCGGKGNRSKLSDLSPLQGMQLTTLFCGGTSVTDLSPVRGMPLTILNVANSPVSDLSPVRGMALTEVGCRNADQLRDFSPLLDCKQLRTLDLVNTQATPEMIEALRKALPNCKIQ